MPEENNNENNRKQKIAALVGLITLLLAVLGATYAFFQIDTDTESSNTNITGSTPDKSLVTLNQEISNLHLNISASDMSLNNVNNEYYATNVEGQAYEDNEEDGTKTIASVELTGGEATTKYSCTAKLTVSRVTEPEEEATDVKDMIEVLQPGDMILQFKGNIISEKLDLSELKTSGSKEYNLSFKVVGNTPEEIQAYIKLINKETQQNYLAGSKLNIDINTSELKCEVFIEDPKVAQLRAKDIEVSEIEHLSTDLQGGMYRYQGTDDVPNWICFGTADKNQCIDETDSDSNDIPDGIDKYMYRIIGITEEGQMYLLKETFLKEGETNTFTWNSKYRFSDCLVDGKDICEWPNSDLYKRLNGTSNGETPGKGYPSGDTNIFLGTNEHPSSYDYLTEGTKWYNLIADHNWMYGDSKELKYNGDEMYAIETGNIVTKRNWPKNLDPLSCGGFQCPEENYEWTESESAKIGLMYRHDVLYAYPDGNPESSINVTNSWIHFQKDGYSTSYYSPFITRLGIGFTPAGYNNFIRMMSATQSGFDSYNTLSEGFNVRPVFYLLSTAKIKEGTDGTKENPYILDVQTIDET